MTHPAKTIFADADARAAVAKNTVEIEFFALNADGKSIASGVALLSQEVAHRLHFDLTRALSMPAEKHLASTAEPATPREHLLSALRKAGGFISRRDLMIRLNSRLPDRKLADQELAALLEAGSVVQRVEQNPHGRPTVLYSIATKHLHKTAT